MHPKDGARWASLARPLRQGQCNLSFADAAEANDRRSRVATSVEELSFETAKYRVTADEPVT
jgi:hypothetical protein